MSTIKADAIEAATGTDTDLVLTGKGTGVPDIETGFKVSGTAGLPLSDLRAGTAGNLITYDASGNPAAVATGTVGQVLTSGGAGVAPTMQDAATPIWEFVSSTAVTGSPSTVDLTGFAAGYDYQVVITDMTISANVGVVVQFGTGAGPTWVTSTYRWQAVGGNNTSASGGRSTSDSDINILGGLFSTTTNPRLFSELTIFNPGDSGSYTNLHARTSAQTSSTGNAMGIAIVAGDYPTAAAVTGLRIKPDSGTLTTGTVRLYRRSTT